MPDCIKSNLPDSMSCSKYPLKSSSLKRMLSIILII
uniref:Uncharacterized protein n=1 Tax=Siphoviridae sp. ctBLh2 TaxID=2827803 RepID=A0A8S5S3Y7_9CAUD|nr:MAG TPA: hypothetical protein [Siphoviridae sp. ctBLh2]